MRILIVAPQQTEASGNLVTARRYLQGMLLRGHAAQLLTVAPGEAERLSETVAAFRPDLLHLLHASRVGLPWLKIRDRLHLPGVTSLTGTDVNHDLDDPALGPLVRGVLENSAALLTQNPTTAEALPARFPELAGKIRYLPPGIILGTDPWPLRRQAGIAPQTVVFLHPAGIRPVKGNLELLQLFAPLAARWKFMLGFCGPVLDARYGQSFLAEVERCPWTRYLGILPPSAVPAALAEADVVVNNSLSEGLPNALLEAASLGRPMLARDIPGNAAVVEEGVNGLLYANAEEFADKAAALLESAELRRRLSVPLRERYHPEREAQRLEEIYRGVLAEEGK
ncbi:glycosyl transferase [Desulfuromonas versatilis]|uniref:Glycosyl transferase n=1 Tax=Desulfuromonas versatilis TaxID=2802975 RepID=A0ABM8HUQ1_9BACT|nr:glycosyltransferase [Desulfuromonas versatilis]BCR04221.1 glycosyl transferase [Desulfuromonas versatilis]